MSAPDVIVIGGGVIGLISSLRLAQRKASVLLVEREQCGSGASSASLGVLAPPSPARFGPFQRMHWDSLAMYPAFSRELLELTGIDPGYCRCESIELLPSESQLQQAEREAAAAELRGLEAGGEPALRVLSPGELAALEPFVHRTPFGALLNRSTACISIGRLLEALKDAACAAGVRLLEGTAVTGIEYVQQRATGVRTSGGVLSSSAVLAAAGVWTGGIDPVLHYYAATEPVRGQALEVHSVECPTQRIVKWDGSYAVPQGNGIYALGSTTEADAGFTAATTPEGIQDILAKVHLSLPALAGARIVRSWAGLRPAAAGKDRKPYLGAVPGVQGLYVAAGHYKIGFGYAPLTGEALADLITNGATEHPIAAFPPRHIESNKAEQTWAPFSVPPQ